MGGGGYQRLRLITDVSISSGFSNTAALQSLCIFNEAVASVQFQPEQDWGRLS